MDQCFAIDHCGCVPDRQAADELSAVMKECQENKISKAFLNVLPGKRNGLDDGAIVEHWVQCSDLKWMRWE